MIEDLNGTPIPGLEIPKIFKYITNDESTLI